MSTFIGHTVGTFCVLARRSAVTGILLEWLRRHFASADTVEEPNLKSLIWQPGDEPGILIDSVWNWNPQLAGIRPAVLVRPGPYTKSRFAIGDRHPGYGDLEGNDLYACDWIGSHTLFCLAREGGAVELLAAEVQRELNQYSLVVAQHTNLRRFEVVRVDEVSLVEEAGDVFAVPITVGYAWMERWIVRKETRLFQSLNLSAFVR